MIFSKDKYTSIDFSNDFVAYEKIQVIYKQ